MGPSLVEELRPLFAGRKVVLTGGPLAALTGTCRRLRDLGAERPFLLATGMGTGEVVPAEAAALRAAAGRLDQGAGTAWAGDARQGFHGGAFGLRWVRGEEDVVEAVAFLAARCDRVRVMPFLEGVPCSIHGVVFPDGVATFRPVEMVTLRRPGSNRLRYAGAATFWDPPAADREVMRDLARRVGAGLRERVGCRGAFTVDGVLAAEGFLPTELNPRLGAGLSMMTRDLPGLPVSLLDRALVEGEPLAYGAGDLERQVLAAADPTRAGGAWTVTERRPGPGDATRTLAVTFEGGACRPAADGRPADGVLSFGPSGVGGFVRLALDPGRVPVGPSVAPLAVAAFVLADERFGSGIGPLEPARAVR